MMKNLLRKMIGWTNEMAVCAKYKIKKALLDLKRFSHKAPVASIVFILALVFTMVYSSYVIFASDDSLIDEFGTYFEEPDHGYVYYGKFPQSLADGTNGLPSWDSSHDGETYTLGNDEYLYELDKNDNGHWYKIEPIKWQILEVNTTKNSILLWSESVLESRIYDSCSVTTLWGGYGGGVDPNDSSKHQYPTLRLYLNGYDTNIDYSSTPTGNPRNYSALKYSKDWMSSADMSLYTKYYDKPFIDKAFTSREQEVMLPTLPQSVYGLATTSENDLKNYYGEFDKVRMLGRCELSTNVYNSQLSQCVGSKFGFGSYTITGLDSNRVGFTTAYSESKLTDADTFSNAYYSEVGRNSQGYYQLDRSSNALIQAVRYDGDAGMSCLTRNEKNGVRPVIELDVNELLKESGTGSISNPYVLKAKPFDASVKPSDFTKWNEDSSKAYLNFGTFPKTQLTAAEVTSLGLPSTPDDGKIYQGNDGKDYLYEVTTNTPKYNSNNGWYKIEPIKWQVLDIKKGTNNEDELVLLSESILEARKYDTLNGVYLYWDGKGVVPAMETIGNRKALPMLRLYLNNYDVSNSSGDPVTYTGVVASKNFSARTYEEHPDATYYNKGFLEKAFTSAERNLIMPDVPTDTNWDSAYDGDVANYVDANGVKDKVRLLTQGEVTNNSSYGFTGDTSRYGFVTDYTLLNITYKSDSKCTDPAGVSRYTGQWVNSTQWNMNASMVSHDGTLNSNSRDLFFGIRPVITINIAGLSKDSGNGSITDPYTFTYGPETYTINVKVNTGEESRGTISSSDLEGTNSSLSGSFSEEELKEITITATAKEGFAFDGWYKGTELVSSDKTYKFTPNSSINLVAKFIEPLLINGTEYTKWFEVGSGGKSHGYVTLGSYPQRVATAEEASVLDAKYPSPTTKLSYVLDEGEYAGTYLYDSIKPVGQRWYKFEPIVWRILNIDETTNKGYLLSDSVLDTYRFVAYEKEQANQINRQSLWWQNGDVDSSDTSRKEYPWLRLFLNSYDGKLKNSGKANWYLSKLNISPRYESYPLSGENGIFAGFYNIAFNDEEQNVIVSDTNLYKLPSIDGNLNQTDKVRMLSYEEMYDNTSNGNIGSSFGFASDITKSGLESNRVAFGTDYSTINYNNTTLTEYTDPRDGKVKKGQEYWTISTARTTFKPKIFYAISSNGVAVEEEYATNNVGIRPVITVDLSAVSNSAGVGSFASPYNLSTGTDEIYKEELVSVGEINYYPDGYIDEEGVTHNGEGDVEVVSLNNDSELKAYIYGNGMAVFEGTDNKEIEVPSNKKTNVTKVAVSNNGFAPKSTSSMLSGMTNLESADLKNLNGTNLDDMSGMFDGCEKLEKVEFSSSLDTSNVDDFSDMFKDCSSLTTLNLESFTISENSTTTDMFSGCTNLEKINVPLSVDEDIEPELPVNTGSSWSVYKSDDTKLKSVTALPGKNTNALFSYVQTVPPVLLYEDPDDSSKKYYDVDALYTWDIATTEGGGVYAYYFDGNKRKDGVTDTLREYDGELVIWTDPNKTDATMIGFTTSVFLDGSDGVIDLQPSEECPISSDNYEDYLEGRGYEFEDVYVYTVTPWSILNSFSTHKIKTVQIANETKLSTGEYLFGRLSQLSEINNISLLDTSSVSNMNYMFFDCSSLTSLDLGDKFDTSNVTIMEGMFNDCSNLETLILGDMFTTPVAKSMRYMFKGCKKLESLDLENFTTPNVTNMAGMFDGCSSLETLDVSSFDTSKVQFMSNMFNTCSKLTTLNLSNFNTSNVTNMSYMFDKCNALSTLTFGTNFVTTKVTNMSYMFEKCSSLETLDISSFDTTKVTNMSYMFNECSSLTSLDLGSNFNTSQVLNMRWMFSGCASLTGLDLGEKFDTSRVTDMSCMFDECSSLTSLDLGDGFDTSQVTDMFYMFTKCSSLTSLDLGNKFNTSQVEYMAYMFSGLDKMTSFDISNFDMSCVLDASYMFSGSGLEDSAITTITFNNSNEEQLLNTSYTSIDDMFATLVNLQTLDITGFYLTGEYDLWNMLGSDDETLPTKIILPIKIEEDVEVLLPDVPEGYYWAGEDGTIYENLPEKSASNNYISLKSSIIEIGEGTNKKRYDVRDALYSWDISKEGEEGSIFAYYFDGKKRKDGTTSTLREYDGELIIYSNDPEAEMIEFNTAAYKKNGHIELDGGTDLECPFNSSNYEDYLTSRGFIYNLDTYDRYNTPWSILEACSSHKVKNIQIANSTKISSGKWLFAYMKSAVTIDVSKLDVSDASNFYYTFYNCEKLSNLNLGENFDTASADYMYGMFENCSSLQSLNLGTKFDTSDVWEMDSMFSGCSSLTSLDLGDNFDTSSAQDMGFMFRYCSQLTELDLGDNFDTSSVKTFGNMFEGCSSLTSLDLGDKFYTTGLDLSDGYSVEYMFKNCSSLTSLDLGENFDTENAVYMASMFEGCSSLTSLDLGDKFDTSNALYMDNMFDGCSSLTELDLSTFTFSSEVTTEDFFKDTSKLTKIVLPISVEAEIDLPVNENGIWIGNDQSGPYTILPQNDGDLTYIYLKSSIIEIGEGVNKKTYNVNDALYTWDVSDKTKGNGAGSIMAYYFRGVGAVTGKNYGDGTLIIKDVNPSSDPNDPNRLMTFTCNSIYVNSTLNGSPFIHVVAEFYEDYYSSVIIDNKEVYKNFDSYLENPVHGDGFDYITSPWSNMNAHSEFEDKDEFVYEVIVANDVHVGYNMMYLFGGLNKCTYMDLSKLKYDYEYIYTRDRTSEIMRDLFGRVENCEIKMFDNSSYLWFAFNKAKNITLDYSDVNMDFNIYDPYTYYQCLGENEITKIKLPKKILNSSGTVDLLKWLTTSNGQFDQFNNEIPVEHYPYEVFDENGNSLGYTTVWIDQDKVIGSSLTKPSYMVLRKELSLFDAYNMYVDGIKTISILPYWVKEGVGLINSSSLHGKTNVDMLAMLTSFNNTSFDEEMFTYMKEKIDAKFGANYKFPNDVEIDLTDENNPFGYAVKVLNEYIDNIFEIEGELGTTDKIFNFLDEVTINIKTFLGKTFEKTFNAFYNGNKTQINYYDILTHSLNDFSKMVVSSNTGTFDDTDPEKVVFTVRLDNSLLPTIDGQDAYYLMYALPDADATNHLKITLSEDAILDDNFYITYVTDITDAMGMDVKTLTKDDFTSGVFELDFIDTSMPLFGQIALFGITDTSLKDNGSSTNYATVEVTLPKYGYAKTFALGEVNASINFDVMNTNIINLNLYDDCKFKELTDYYVIELIEDKRGLIPVDISKFNKGVFYYGNCAIIDPVNSSSFAYVDSSPITYDSLNDSNIDGFISEGKLKRAEMNISSIPLAFDGYAFKLDSGYSFTNNVVVIPKHYEYEGIATDNTFNMVLKKIGEIPLYAVSHFFKNNSGFESLIDTVFVNSISLNMPSNPSNDKFKLVVNDGTNEHEGIFGLPVNETDGATFSDIKLFRINNKGNEILVPSDDYEVSYANNKGSRGEEATLTLSGKDDGPITGQRSYTFDLYQVDLNLNGVDDAYEKITIDGKVYKPNDALYTWDISKDGDGSILAYYFDGDKRKDGVTSTLREYDGELVIYSNSSTSEVMSLNKAYYKTDGASNTSSVAFDKYDSDLASERWTINYTPWSILQNIKNIDIKEVHIPNTFKIKNGKVFFKGLTKVEELDISKIDMSQNTTCEDMFGQCPKLKNVTLNNTTSFLLKNMSSMFYCDKALEKVTFGENFNTSGVTDMSCLFNGCFALDDVDVSNFDTTSVKDVAFMFSYTGFEELDLSHFNLPNLERTMGMFEEANKLKNVTFNDTQIAMPNLTDMSEMFYNCYSLEDIDLTYFDTSNVDDISSMFFNCVSLEEIDLSHNDFSKASWNSSLFAQINSIEDYAAWHDKLDWYLSASETEKEEYENDNSCYIAPHESMLKHIYFNEDQTFISSYYYTFLGLCKLEELDLSTFVFTSDKTFSDNTLYHTDSLKKIILPTKTSDLTAVAVLPEYEDSYWTGYKDGVKVGGRYETLPFNYNDTGEIDEIRLFSSIIEIGEGQNKKTYNVNDALYTWDISKDGDGSILAYYFDGDKRKDGVTSTLREYDGELVICSNSSSAESIVFDTAYYNEYLNTIGKNQSSDDKPNSPASGKTVDDYLTERGFVNVGDKQVTYSPWSILQWIKGKDIKEVHVANEFVVNDASRYFAGLCKPTTIDISKMNLENATSLARMFYYCSSLTSMNLDVKTTNDEDVSSLTDISYMFNNCNKITTITFGDDFDTSKVTDMKYLFYECNELTNVNVDKLNTSSLESTYHMFGYCSKLEDLDLSSWNLSNIKDMGYMFDTCVNLESVKFNKNMTTPNLTDTSGLFYCCFKLGNVDLSMFSESNITIAGDMFTNCVSMTEIDLRDIDLSNARSNWQFFLAANDIEEYADWNGKLEWYLSASEIEREEYEEENASNIPPHESYLEHIYFNEDQTYDPSYYNATFFGLHNLKELDLSTFVFKDGMTFGNRDLYHLYSLNSIILPTKTSDTTVVIDLPEYEDSYWTGYKDGVKVGGRYETLPFNYNDTGEIDEIRLVSSIIKIGDKEYKPSEALYTWDISKGKKGTIFAYYFETGETNSDGVKEGELIFYSLNDTDTSEFDSFIGSSFGKIEWDWNIDVDSILSNVDFSDETDPYYYETVLNDPHGFYITKQSGGTEKSVIPWQILETFDAEHTIKTVIFANDLHLGESAKGYFGFLPNVTEFKGMEHLKTGNVKNFVWMFRDDYNIESLDITNFDLTNAKYLGAMFREDWKLNDLDFTNWDTSGVDDFDYMFLDCISLTELDLSSFNTENATDMGGMFIGCVNLSNLNISSFNTSKVKHFYLMFANCNSLQNIDISHFDFTNAYNLETYSMFASTPTLRDYIELIYDEEYDDVVSDEDYFNKMQDEYSTLGLPKKSVLKSINLGDSLINVCPRTFFYGLESLEEIDISNMSFENCTTSVNIERIFGKCSSLKKIILPSDIPTCGDVDLPAPPSDAMWMGNDGSGPYEILPKSDGDLTYVFLKSSIIEVGEGVNKKKYNINDALYTWDISKVGEEGSIIAYFFDGDEDKDGNPYTREYKGELVFYSNDDTKSVIPFTDFLHMNDSVKCVNYSDGMQAYSNSYKYKSKTIEVRLTGREFIEGSNAITPWSLLLRDDGVNPVKEVVIANTLNLTSADKFFAGLNSLEKITNIENLNTDNLDITNSDNMKEMFFDCTSLQGTLDLSHMNFANAKSLESMFCNCYKLKEIIFDEDIDTTNVTNMSGMFNECYKLTDIDLTNFDTLNVENMAQMFDYCKSLVTLDLSNFNTGNVQSMASMFRNCNKLKGTKDSNGKWHLDLSSFDTEDVSWMSYMFDNCQSLEDIIFGSDFKTANVDYFGGMFINCINLTNLDLTTFDINTENLGSMFAVYRTFKEFVQWYVSDDAIPDDASDDFDIDDINNMDDGYEKDKLLEYWRWWEDYKLQGSSKLKTITFKEGKGHDINDDTDGIIIEAYGMFQGLESLEKLDLSKFVIYNDDIDLLFIDGCTSLKEIILPLYIEEDDPSDPDPDFIYIDLPMPKDDNIKAKTYWMGYNDSNVPYRKVNILVSKIPNERTYVKRIFDDTAPTVTKVESDKNTYGSNKDITLRVTISEELDTTNFADISKDNFYIKLTFGSKDAIIKYDNYELDPVTGDFVLIFKGKTPQIDDEGEFKITNVVLINNGEEVKDLAGNDLDASSLDKNDWKETLKNLVVDTTGFPISITTSDHQGASIPNGGITSDDKIYFDIDFSDYTLSPSKTLDEILECFTLEIKNKNSQKILKNKTLTLKQVKDGSYPFATITEDQFVQNKYKVTIDLTNDGDGNYFIEKDDTLGYSVKVSILKGVLETEDAKNIATSQDVTVQKLMSEGSLTVKLQREGEPDKELIYNKQKQRFEDGSGNEVKFQDGDKIVITAPSDAKITYKQDGDDFETPSNTLTINIVNDPANPMKPYEEIGAYKDGYSVNPSDLKKITIGFVKLIIITEGNGGTVTPVGTFDIDTNEVEITITVNDDYKASIYERNTLKNTLTEAGSYLVTNLKKLLQDLTVKVKFVSTKAPTPPSGGGGGGGGGAPAGPTYTVLPPDEIEVIHKAYMNGYEDHTFRPSENMSREEVATIVARLHQEFTEDFNFTSFNTFGDAENRWSKNYIGFCKMKDLIHGYEDGSFHPTNIMTRAELATLVNNFLRVQNANYESVDLSKPAFSDVDGRWYEESVNKLAHLGILNGYEDGTFRGDNPVSRIEVAIVMNKINHRNVTGTIPQEYIDKTTSMFKDITPNRWYFKDVAEAAVDHPENLY